MAHSSLGRGTRTGTAGGTWQSGLGGWARASDTRSPARHCSSMISLAFGLGAAEIRALTSANSKYSGSLKPFFRINCCNVPPLGLIPGGPSCSARWCSWVQVQQKGHFCYIRRSAWINAVTRLCVSCGHQRSRRRPTADVHQKPPRCPRSDARPCRE